jgi:hypothetical protein
MQKMKTCKSNFHRSSLMLALSIVCCVCSSVATAQNWVMYVTVDVNHGDCAIEAITGSGVSFDGFAGVFSSQSSPSADSYVITGSGDANGTLTAWGSGSCSMTYEGQPSVGSFSDNLSVSRNYGSCYASEYLTSFTSETDLESISVSIRFYPQLPAPSVSVNCTQATLTSGTCVEPSSPYYWYVSNAAGGTYYYALASSSATVSATAAQLHRSEFGSNPYQTRWVRVAGSGNPLSPPSQVDFVVPPPSIVSVQGFKPVCPDGEGTIQIQHGADTPLSAEFVYTVTQYVLRTAGDCPPGYGSGNTIDHATISALPSTVCGGAASTVNLGSNVYCSGLIGNFRKTFPVAGGLTYTLNSGDILEKNTTNTLKLYPGIYKVSVEADINPDGRNCPCSYFIEIPAADPTPAIPAPGIVNPSCKGGNDGSAIFKITRRGDYDATNDIQYSLKKGASYYTDVNSVVHQNRSVDLNGSGQFTISNLVEGSDYVLTVLDNCHNSPMTRSFSVGAGTTFTLGSSSVDPTCTTASTGNGTITLSATFVAGKTYTYSLFSSGGSPIGSPVGGQGSTYTFTGLKDLDYYATVSTDNQCQASTTPLPLNGSSTFIPLTGPSVLTSSAPQI